jgi:S-adenosylhomocysteine hydrolase
MILDDGGDATLLMHLGKRAEKDASVSPSPTSEEETCLYAAIKAKLASRRHLVQPQVAPQIIGVTEETTTGVHRLNEMSPRARCCSAPSTSTTRSPRASSTTSTAAANRWSTASSAPPT